MKVLAGGATVIDGGELAEVEGSRRYRVPISKSTGARDISQTISVYARGPSPARRNPIGEEVLFVVRGEGACYINGHRYAIAGGTAAEIEHLDVTRHMLERCELLAQRLGEGGEVSNLEWEGRSGHGLSSFAPMAPNGVSRLPSFDSARGQVRVSGIGRCRFSFPRGTATPR